MTVNYKNLLAGLLFVGIGLFFGLQSLFMLRIGTASNMGPGFFPLLLGGLLAVLGTAISVTSLGRPHEPMGAVPWRGTALVMASVLFFAVTVRGLGFAPALAGSGLMASLASRKLGMVGSVVLALGIALFGSLVFVVGLNLPYPLLGRWITG